MSLDIAILGADGSPKKQVSIGVDDHYRLMQLVGERGGTLARLNDYYTDAEFEHSEMDGLAEEVRTLLVRCRDDEGLLSFLNGLSELIVEAKQEQKPLVAIADWTGMSAQEQAGLVAKWQKDLARNQEIADVLRGLAESVR